MHQIRFACPRCKAVCDAPPKSAGQSAACPRCGQRLVIPGSTPPHTSPRPDWMESPQPETVGSDEPRGRPIAAVQTSSPAVPRPAAREENQATGSAPELRRSPWRIVRYSTLLLALLLFPLPWVEVSCSPPGGGGGLAVTQSGLQAAYGGRSLAPFAEKYTAEVGREMAKAGAPRQQRGEADKGNVVEKRLPPAPLMLLFPLIVASGLGISFTRLPAAGRVAGTAAALALALMLVQAAIGFPVPNQLAEEMARQAVASATHDGANAGAAAVAAPLMLTVRLTGWFWLAAVSLAAGAATPLVEWAVRRHESACPPDKPGAN